MHITNKLGLPENVVNAAKRAVHKKGDYSVTELEKSPREYWLTNRHNNEIYIDVSEMLYMLLGSAFHEILDKGKTENQLTEEYLTHTFQGKILSGTTDLYENESIKDFKTTSVWTMIYDSRSEGWEKQLNCYAYLFRAAGFVVNHLEIIALFKDWSRSKSKYDPRFPQASMARVDVALWPQERIEAYINERIGQIEACKSLADKDLPFCTDSEMWRKEAVYKCMKPGAVKSKKNFDKKDEAEAYCKENNLTLLEVPGECTKCLNYCYGAQFCSQFLQGSPPPVSSNDFEATLNAAKKKFAAPEATIEMLLEDK